MRRAISPRARRGKDMPPAMARELRELGLL